MAIPSEQAATTICAHCDRAIPTLNIDLHNAHCQRNLTKCKNCGDMVPKRLLEEHYLNTHAPGYEKILQRSGFPRVFGRMHMWGTIEQVACSLCNETMDREILAVHKGESCPQRIVTCEYCEFPLPAVDLSEHQGVCGNRTEYCELCQKYIRLRERTEHETMVHGSSDNTAGPSRDARRPDRREQGPGRRRLNGGVSHKHLLWTFAITGVAVLLGSLFLQRKSDDNQLLGT